VVYHPMSDDHFDCRCFVVGMDRYWSITSCCIGPVTSKVFHQKKTHKLQSRLDMLAGFGRAICRYGKGTSYLWQ
jgi:hypothetical protein